MEEFEASLKKTTPLHIAHHEGNNRSINVLMKYMAKINSNATNAVSDILPELVEQQQFIPFMNGLSFQSLQMLNKQTLKIESMFSKSIASINRSGSSYVDDAYFIKQVGEDKNNIEYKNFPVRVDCLRIDWIINTDEGKRFLNAIFQTQ